MIVRIYISKRHWVPVAYLKVPVDESDLCLRSVEKLGDDAHLQFFKFQKTKLGIIISR